MKSHVHESEPGTKKHDVIIVGFGHAGRIHQRAYDALADVCRIAAVVEPDPVRMGEFETSLPGIRIYPQLDAALSDLGGNVIVDFCVPAMMNLSLVETALNFGCSKFLIEKPLGWDVDSTHSLVSKLSRCDVVYMDTYAASRGVQELIKRIGEQGFAPRHVHVLFHKNRVPDSTLSRGFIHDAVPNAWMIEGPHMLSIARQIAGEITHVSDSSTFDMDIGMGQILTDHGGGYALLGHRSGAVTHIDLSLCSGRNERRIEVQLWNDVRICVDLPPSKTTEQFSALELLYPSGQREAMRFEDRPMEYCVQNAIRYLCGENVVVSDLSDGLAVCETVERIMEKNQFWQSAPKQWKYFGPPLRPCAEDIGIMEKQIAQWMANSSGDGCNALLCGVTPEIVEMNWPAGTRLWAVEKSRAMIDEVWPPQPSGAKQPLLAEWTRLPFEPESFDIVIGDGCFTSLEFPRLQLAFLESVRRVMRRDSLLIMRFFAQRDEPELPETVFGDLRAGKIGSFHTFKWRLAMAMQKTARDGVRVDDIWQAWNAAGITTPWPAQTVNTINTYRGSDHRLTFTDMREIRQLHTALFTEKACYLPGYELGERCPIMVYSPK